MHKYAIPVCALMLFACNSGGAPADAGAPEATPEPAYTHKLGTDYPPFPTPGDAGLALISGGKGQNMFWGQPSISNLDASALSPGTAGQVLFSNLTPATGWQTPPLDYVSNHSGIDCTGSADSSSALTSLIAADAPNGVATFIPNGCTLKIATPIVPVSNALLKATAGAIINCTVPTNPPAAGACFFAQGTPGFGLNIGSLASTPVVGSSTLSVTASGGTPTTGDYIALVHGLSEAIYKETNVTGSGPYTVTLDRPLIIPSWTSGDAVLQYTAIAQNIILDGGGATMQGSGGGDLYFELQGCRNCAVRNWNIKGGAMRASAFWASYDEGSFNSSWENITYDGANDTSSGTGVTGPVAEGGERILIRNVVEQNMTGNGPSLIDCANSGIENSTVNKGAGQVDGMGIGTQGSSYGSFYSWISNSLVTTSTNAGIEVDKCTGCRLYNVSGLSSGTGIFVTGNATDTIVDGASTYQSGTGGGIDNAGTGSIFRNLHLFESVASGGTSAFFTNTSAVIDGFDITSGGGAFAGEGIDVNAGTNTIVTNGTITLATASRIAIGVTAGNVDVSGVTVATSQATTYGIFGNGGTITVGEGNSLSAPTTPISGAYSSKLVGSSVSNDGSGNTTVTSSAGTLGLAPNGTTSLVMSESGSALTCTVPAALTGGATFATTKPTGTGTTPGPGFSFTAAQGQTASGGTNNAGGSFNFTPGIPGTGGTNGAYGAINVLTSSTDMVTIGDWAAAGGGVGPGSWGSLWFVTNSPSSTNFSVLGDQTATYVNVPTSGNLNFSQASTIYMTMTTAALSPNTFGLLSNGTSSLPWGATYLGASTTSGTGYTAFLATTGTHNTQDGITAWTTDEERISSYSAKNFQTYTVAGGAHHGLSYNCTVTGRVVTAGSGTDGGSCSFWATGAHGAPDTTYSCTFRGTAYYNGSTWANYANAYYIVCDVTTSGNPAGGTVANPVMFLSATQSGASVTLQWSLFNDSCGTPPVVDAQNTCQIMDN